MQEPNLTQEQKTRLQKACGLFLYYARAVDPTMLHALNELSTEITIGNQETIKKLNHFLDYCATHNVATIRYYASDMILWVHSDAGYNNSNNARSRAGGHFYLGNESKNEEKKNGAILKIVLKENGTK